MAATKSVSGPKNPGPSGKKAAPAAEKSAGGRKKSGKPSKKSALAPKKCPHPSAKSAHLPAKSAHGVTKSAGAGRKWTWLRTNYTLGESNPAAGREKSAGGVTNAVGSAAASAYVGGVGHIRNDNRLAHGLRLLLRDSHLAYTLHLRAEHRFFAPRLDHRALDKLLSGNLLVRDSRDKLGHAER